MQVAKGMKLTGKGIEGKERKSEVSITKFSISLYKNNIILQKKQDYKFEYFWVVWQVRGNISRFIFFPLQSFSFSFFPNNVLHFIVLPSNHWQEGVFRLFKNGIKRENERIWYSERKRLSVTFSFADELSWIRIFQ